MRERMPAAVCLLSFAVAVPAALWNTDWGWMITAILIATAGWRIEEWLRRD
jgi:hypothetical protein